MSHYVVRDSDSNKPFLEDRVAIVTGASGDIGFAISQALLESGVILYGHYFRNYRRLDELKKKYSEDRVSRFEMDFLGENFFGDDITTEIKHNIGGIYGRHHRLDILVNAVGIWDVMRVMDETEGFRERVMKINYYVPMLFAVESFKYMMGQQGTKHVINIGSIAGIRGTAQQASYSASKGALRSFSQSLAEEGANYGINVNVISPGFVDTQATRKIFPDDRSIKLLAKSIPKYALATPQDVANACLGVLMNDYLTGADIILHGGREPIMK